MNRGVVGTGLIGRAAPQKDNLTFALQNFQLLRNQIHHSALAKSRVTQNLFSIQSAISAVFRMESSDLPCIIHINLHYKVYMKCQIVKLPLLHLYLILSICCKFQDGADIRHGALGACILDGQCTAAGGEVQYTA